MHHKETKGKLTGVRVLCSQSKCMYYQSDPLKERGFCVCIHHDKVHHLKQFPCPLYRMNLKNNSLLDSF